MASKTKSVFPKNRNFVSCDFLGPKTDSVGPKTSIIITDDPVSGTAVDYAEFDSENQLFKVDTINEFTAAAGVTIDGVLIKDNQVRIPNDTYFLARNNAGSADLNLFKANASDEALVGLPLTVDGSITNNDATLVNPFVWQAQAGAIIEFSVNSSANRETHFVNSGAADHLVTVDGTITLNDSTFSNPFTWRAQAGDTAEFIVSSGVNRFTDFVNSGAGNHNLKVNGTTVAVPFMATHRRVLGDVTLKEGEAVKLDLEGRLIRCTEAQDSMCDGIYTSEVVKAVDYVEGHLDSFRRLVHEDIHHVACLGNSRSDDLEGAYVCDDAGPVLPGDYLCTAMKPGFLMKQDSPAFCNYTVAQYRLPKPVEFDENGEAFGIYVYLLKG